MKKILVSSMLILTVLFTGSCSTIKTMVNEPNEILTIQNIETARNYLNRLQNIYDVIIKLANKEDNYNVKGLLSAVDNALKILGEGIDNNNIDKDTLKLISVTVKLAESFISNLK